jgi:hypothetical protein
MEKRFKGLCFAGREHHVKKLRYTMDYLQEREFEIEYITGNNVLNWDNYESPLVQQGKTYHHLLDFLDPASMVEIQRMNTLLQEVQNGVSPNQLGFGDYVSDFFVRFSVRDVAETFVLFRKALEKIEPDVVFILHEGNFWTKSFAFNAKRLGIPVVSFQEGQYAKSAAPERFSPFRVLSEFSERVLLWGSKEFDLFASLGVPLDTLRIVGVPHLDEYLNLSSERAFELRQAALRRNQLPESEKIVLFAVPHSGVAIGDIGVILSDLVEFFKRHGSYALIIRFHPFEAHLQRAFEPLWSQTPNVSCDQASETPDLISAIDLCLCQRTSLGLECLALGKPLVEINYQHTKEDPVGYANQGLAGLISCPEELDRISGHLECSPSDLTRNVLDAILMDSFFSLDGRTSERVHAQLLELLGSKQAI